jgi:hypothetical protein
MEGGPSIGQLFTHKLAGRPLTDDEVGPVTWDVWMDKKG